MALDSLDLLISKVIDDFFSAGHCKISVHVISSILREPERKIYRHISGHLSYTIEKRSRGTMVINPKRRGTIL